MGWTRILSSISHPPPPFDPQLTPKWPLLAPQLAPKWSPNGSKKAQNWVKNGCQKSTLFFIDFLWVFWSKIGSKIVVFFDDFWAWEWLQPTCENLQKTWKNRWFLMIFLVSSDQKIVKILSKLHLSNVPTNDVHFWPILRSKIDQKSTKNGSKMAQNVIKKRYKQKDGQIYWF